MKNSSYLFLCCAVVLLFAGSCRTVREIKALAKCEFRIQSVKNTSLAGINVQNVRSYNDLKLGQAATIARAYASGNLPLTFTLNVDVRNPNDQLAALNRLEWIALFDQTELVRGNVTQRVAVNPNGGVATIPLQVRCNVRDVLGRLAKDKALGSAFEIKDRQDKPKRVALKLKPAITVGKKGRSIAYPGYITVKKDFTAN